MTTEMDFKFCVNRIFELVAGANQVASNWGIYLLHKDFDGEPELRNKLGVIWFCSLLDSVGALDNSLPHEIRLAKKHGWTMLLRNIEEVSKLIEFSKSLLSTYSRNEQIAIRDLRDQWVHGYISRRNQEASHVTYFANGKLVKERISRDEYSAIIRGWVTGKSLDEHLTSVLAAALNPENEYWKAHRVLQELKWPLYKCLMENKPVKIVIPKL